MKTQSEIAAKIAEKDPDDFFGFRAEALLYCLDFEHARPWLKDETSAEKWNEPRERVYGGSPLPPCTTPELVRALMRDYAAFAWTKVEDHRGISADRSVSKLSAWIWVLGDDNTLAKVKAAPYPQYGAPKLRSICEAYGFPIPVSEDLSRMMRGERCSATYDCGCGF